MTEDSDNPIISVIIVNFNGRDLLGPCLESVTSQRYAPVEIILVDNGSSDESIAYVRSRFPHVRILVNQSNLGFAGGNNSGFSAARGTYVALLNNDVVVDGEWLTALYRYLRTHDAAIVASLVLTDGTPREDYAMNGTLNFLGYNIMRQFTDLSQVFYASAASVLFRRTLVERPFLDEYFLYHEDVFLSWKLRLRGLVPAMAQDSIVHHRGSVSTQRERKTKVTYYQERNRLLNALLFFEARTLVLLLPYFIVDAAAKLVNGMIGRGKSAAGILRGYWWLLTHMAWVHGQRKEIQVSRVVADRAILALMSAKVLDSESLPARICNALSRKYATIVGLAYHA